MMKRQRIGLTALLLIGAFSAGVFAEDVSQVFFNLVKLEVNGKTSEAPTILYRGTTYVPVRFVAEELGATVQWEQAEKKVIIKNNPASVLEDSMPQWQQNGYQLMWVPTADAANESDKKLREEMEYQIRNVDVDARVMSLDGAVTMLVTPQNRTGYNVERLTIEYRHSASGKTYRLRWHDIEAQGTGYQKRIYFDSEVKGGQILPVKMWLTFSDGKGRNEFEVNYE